MRASNLILRSALLRASRRMKPPLAAPGRADQKAEPERQAYGCERALGNDVFQRFLDRRSRVVGCIHHGAATLRHIVDRRIDIGPRLLEAAAGLFSGGGGQRGEGGGG